MCCQEVEGKGLVGNRLVVSLSALGVQPNAGYGVLLAGGIDAFYAGDEARVDGGDFTSGLDE